MDIASKFRKKIYKIEKQLKITLDNIEFIHVIISLLTQINA